MSSPVTPHSGAAIFFTSDHRACDAAWALVEAAADANDAPRALEAFTHFDAVTRRHLGLEEEVLFPAFEAATGMTMGPTQMMRLEHVRMRGMLDQLAIAARNDLQALLDQGDTLLMFTQQHNAKEECVLYPMTDSALRAQWSDVAGRIAQALAS